MEKIFSEGKIINVGVRNPFSMTGFHNLINKNQYNLRWVNGSRETQESEIDFEKEVYKVELKIIDLLERDAKIIYEFKGKEFRESNRCSGEYKILLEANEQERMSEIEQILIRSIGMRDYI